MGEYEEKNFKFVKIKKHVLKVHIHCQGCEQKVRKLVGKVEGVYKVEIECELQKVSVWGNVECTKLINKLVKSGKHAEPYPSQSYNWVDDDDDDDDWERDLNMNHPIENIDEGEDDDIIMSFPSYNARPRFKTREKDPSYDTLPHFNTREDPNYKALAHFNTPRKDIVMSSFPDNDVLPQFNTLHNSYLGFPLYDYNNHPTMMYNVHAPWYYDQQRRLL